MNPQENEVPSLPTQIDWPQKIDITAENQIKAGFRNHAAHIPVLNIMDQEKNQINASLPEEAEDKLVDEILGYVGAVERLKRGFDLQDEEKRGVIAVEGVKVIGAVEGKLSKSVYYPDTQDEFLAELENDRKLVDDDPTGYTLADYLAKEAFKEKDVRTGFSKGAIEAVKRYKALYSVADHHQAFIHGSVPQNAD